MFKGRKFVTFSAHSYRFSPDLGTFVIECSEDSWRMAGLDKASDEESRSFCADIFKDFLEGAPLVSNRSLWFNPEFVTSRNWHHNNVVLIGDALVNEDERLQARINQLHDRLESTLKQALRFAISEKLIPETTDSAAQANLMIAFVIGRWHQFAKSGFRRDPTEHWAAQWPALG